MNNANKMLDAFRMYLTMSSLKGKTTFTLSDMYELELQLKRLANE